MLFIKLIWTPKPRWDPAQSKQTNMLLFIEHHLGCGLPKEMLIIQQGNVYHIQSKNYFRGAEEAY